MLIGNSSYSKWQKAPTRIARSHARPRRRTVDSTARKFDLLEKALKTVPENSQGCRLQ